MKTTRKIFLAKNYNGQELMSTTPLKRNLENNSLKGYWYFLRQYSDNQITYLPNGFIQTLLKGLNSDSDKEFNQESSEEFSWSDEPLEITEEILQQGI